jgi:hypothetical protein
MAYLVHPKRLVNGTLASVMIGMKLPIVDSIGASNNIIITATLSVTPTPRSYQGYLDGAQSYWRHSGDYRNSTSLDSPNETPVCSSPSQVNGLYSASLETAEVDRIVTAHPKVAESFNGTCSTLRLLF